MSTSRTLAAVAAFAAGPAVLLGVMLGVTVGWVAGVVALVVVAAGVAAWARFGGTYLVRSRLAGRAADARRDARLCNVIEGLCTAAGVRQPEVLIVESDGLNALAAGHSSSSALLAVTTGLVAGLDRIELEAVLAEALWAIRYERIVPATVLAATFGLASPLLADPDLDSRADQGAVSLTRYPPALASAIEKMEAKGATVAGQPRFLAHLWLADPRPDALAGPGRLPLPERVEALREL
ncbi:MAG: M48 family metalloprotease [Acidobacteriota bacterium]|nr:M48 family metalloprotease [Acidobacteriota bacterium]